MVGAVVEVAERFSYYGVSGNLITYLTIVLGQPTATAAKNVNIWSGVSMVSPILGAIVADSYLGRFKTIIISSIIYFMVGSSSFISVNSFFVMNHLKNFCVMNVFIFIIVFEKINHLYAIVCV